MKNLLTPDAHFWSKRFVNRRNTCKPVKSIRTEQLNRFLFNKTIVIFPFAFTFIYPKYVIVNGFIQKIYAGHIGLRPVHSLSLFFLISFFPSFFLSFNYILLSLIFFLFLFSFLLSFLITFFFLSFFLFSFSFFLLSLSFFYSFFSLILFSFSFFPSFFLSFF
ncbi:unnamed protein product [Acanthosepion pharaonis]|uniref:Uncharacterized protein n=1 Tax=Acanthosepion pharaonis TaxID=158019 RepID=A0A812BAS9_ACAPH|nr:unnamed protein product [Sepia pharaonis]